MKGSALPQLAYLPCSPRAQDTQGHPDEQNSVLLTHEPSCLALAP